MSKHGSVAVVASFAATLPSAMSLEFIMLLRDSLGQSRHTFSFTCSHSFLWTLHALRAAPSHPRALSGAAPFLRSSGLRLRFSSVVIVGATSLLGAASLLGTNGFGCDVSRAATAAAVPRGTALRVHGGGASDSGVGGGSGGGGGGSGGGGGGSDGGGGPSDDAGSDAGGGGG